MQLILDTDEAWSIMSLIVSQVLDQAELSDEGTAAVRHWRSDRVEGTGEMSELTVTMNEALGTSLDERTQKLIRRKGWWQSVKDAAGSVTGAVSRAASSVSSSVSSAASSAYSSVSSAAYADSLPPAAADSSLTGTRWSASRPSSSSSSRNCAD